MCKNAWSRSSPKTPLWLNLNLCIPRHLHVYYHWICTILWGRYHHPCFSDEENMLKEIRKVESDPAPSSNKVGLVLRGWDQIRCQALPSKSNLLNAYLIFKFKWKMCVFSSDCDLTWAKELSQTPAWSCFILRFQNWTEGQLSQKI